MGEIIPFTQPGINLRAASRRLGEAAHGRAAGAELLREAQKHLRSAESHGRHALANLDEYLEMLEWTGGFCNRCLAATDLQDVEEMVRQRDALAEAMKHEFAERAPKIVRTAFRR